MILILTQMIFMMMMIPMSLTTDCLWCLPMLIRELFQIRMIADLRGQLRQNALDGQKQKLVKIFYDEIGKRYKMAPEKIDYN